MKYITDILKSNRFSAQELKSLEEFTPRDGFQFLDEAEYDSMMDYLEHDAVYKDIIPILTGSNLFRENSHERSKTNIQLVPKETDFDFTLIDFDNLRTVGETEFLTDGNLLFYCGWTVGKTDGKSLRIINDMFLEDNFSYFCQYQSIRKDVLGIELIKPTRKP